MIILEVRRLLFIPTILSWWEGIPLPISDRLGTREFLCRKGFFGKITDFAFNDFFLASGCSPVVISSSARNTLTFGPFHMGASVL